MPTDLENLRTRRSAILAELAGGQHAYKPSYTEDGRTVSWTEYRAGLLAELKDLATLEQSISGHAFEIRTRLRG